MFLKLGTLTTMPEMKSRVPTQGPWPTSPTPPLGGQSSRQQPVSPVAAEEGLLTSGSNAFTLSTAKEEGVMLGILLHGQIVFNPDLTAFVVVGPS